MPNSPAVRRQVTHMLKLSVRSLSAFRQNDRNDTHFQKPKGLVVTPREFSIEVVRKLVEAGYVAYWAGGCVRDLLLGKDPQDFDVATNAHPEQVREVFGPRRTLAVGESFGVMIVLGPKSGGQVEVATFRSEGEYLDGRRPETVSFVDACEDAQRRDFTINGMFYDPLINKVLDFVGGQQDLQARIVRAIGDPQARMFEDKLRLLRAIRFSSTLDFTLEAETARAVADMASQIVVVSAERITQELKKMLLHPQRAASMRLCEELGLLSVILPEVLEQTQQHAEELWELRLQLLAKLDSPTFEMTLAALLWGVPLGTPDRDRDAEPHTGTLQDVCRRLKLSNAQSRTVQWLVEQHGACERFTEMSLAERKVLATEPHFVELLTLERMQAVVAGESTAGCNAAREFWESTPLEVLNPPELLTGKRLIELGYRPGPTFRHWLQAIRTSQLNETLHTTEEAIALVARWHQAGIDDPSLEQR